MVDSPNMVSVSVQWKENGKVQQRTLQIAEGTVINAENSGKFTAAKAQKGKIPVWNMDKADAYVLLGASHAKQDKEAYKLDKQDIQALNEEWYNSFNDMQNGQLQVGTAVRSGYGAGHINSAFFNTRGEYVVYHGKSDARISIFMK